MKLKDIVLRSAELDKLDHTKDFTSVLIDTMMMVELSACTGEADLDFDYKEETKKEVLLETYDVCIRSLEEAREQIGTTIFNLRLRRDQVAGQAGFVLPKRVTDGG